MRPDLRIALAALVLALAPAIHAAAPGWQQLSSEQQAVIGAAIKGGADNFDRLPEARRQSLAEGALRWLELSPEQRLEASHQFNTWQRMDASQRRAALERRERFRQLPRAEQERLLRERRRFESLPRVEQEKLRQSFRESLQQRGIDPMNVPADGLMPPTLPSIPSLPPPTTTPGPMPSTTPGLPLG